jgi:DNA-binding transcriptional MerR regulator
MNATRFSLSKQASAFRMAFAVMALAGASSVAMAAADTSGSAYDNYVYFGGFYMGADKGRIPSNETNDSFGYQAGVGTRLTNNLWVEGQFFGDTVETGGNQTDYYQTGLGVDLQYAFGQRSEFTPYIVAGLGGVFNDVAGGNNDEVSPYRGRTGIYGDAHLARLRMIGPLLSRGYSLGNIAELIEAWEKGHDLRQLLGLEQAITLPWSEDVPAYYELSELMTAFGRQMSPELLARAVQLNIVQVDGARFKVPSPRLLNAGLELVAMGVPMMALLDVLSGLRANVEQVASTLVQLVVKHAFEPLGGHQLPPASEVPRLAEVIWRLRPIVDMAVDTEVAVAMEKATQRYLGERMDAIFNYVIENKHRKG